MLAAVNGPAVGIGCSLALVADLIVAAQVRYFLLAFVNIGLVPDGGSSLLVPERIGLARAAGRWRCSASGSPRVRRSVDTLSTRVAPDDEFDRVVDELAAHWPATRPTGAYAGIKQQLNAWLFGRMDDQLELEASLQQRSAASGFQEGVQAFLEAAGRIRSCEQPLLGLPSYTADAVAQSRPRPGTTTQAGDSPARRGRRGLGARPCGVRRLVPSGVRRLAQRRRDPHALHPDRADRPRDLHRGRRPADLLADQVPRAQGRVAAQIHQEYPARDRLDGRRRRDPHLPHRVHFPPARQRQEPRPVADRRRGQPDCREHPVRRHRSSPPRRAIR